MNNKMKAVTHTKYGKTVNINLDMIDIPKIKEYELLIKVHATTVNRTDCGILLGKPFIIRFFIGLIKPKKIVLGSDFAGEVVKVGKNVTAFNVGDRVFGFDDGGLSSQAEYMNILEDSFIEHIPDDISYINAVASCEGAHYALNFINKVNIRKMDKIIINGATGAIGSSMLQILKNMDVYVAVVVNTSNVELIRNLGADRVYDYLKEDFTQSLDQYDFVFDAVGKSTFKKSKNILKLKGTYMSSELGAKNENLILPLITKIKNDKFVVFPFPKDISKTLACVKQLLLEKEFNPVIDKVYCIENVLEAYDYVLSGNKTGNVILSLDKN